ncbi:MAG: LysR family transcriptional regulator [Lachnospiraceae bacterium]|nr:LysR family transcriptional regulator [Lachnospiraceae bacterium]
MFRNMEYVYAVYESKSFSKAAEKLHISQPSLSAMIKKIEQQAGTSIFNRKTFPISLTPFGIEYIRAIEQIFEITDYIQNIAYDTHALNHGKLSIGASNLSVESNLTNAIAEFKTTYPNIQLNIFEASTIQAKSMLDSGDLDLMITNRPLSQNKYSRILCQCEFLILAVPDGYPINEQYQHKQLTLDELKNLEILPPEKEISLKDFSEIPFILLRDDNYLRSCTNTLFQSAGFEPNITLELDQSCVSMNFARMGIGATIFSNRLINSQNYEGLKYYKISGDLSRRDMFIFYRKTNHISLAMKHFIDMICKKSV